MNGNGQWKWMAGLLAALIIGAFPGCIAFWRAPTREDFDKVQTQTAAMQVQLAVLTAQNAAMLEVMKDAQQRIILLQTRGD